MKKQTALQATAATPHVLYAAINDRKPLVDVLSELIDNAFGPEAGNASTISIEIYDDKIVVTDNGRGIDDLNKLASMGATGSYGSQKDIGQYGQGSKTWLGIAKKLFVETCRNGLIHHHLFDTTPIRRALKKGANTKWLNEYNGKGKASSQKSFTRLTLLELTKGPQIIFDTLVGDLSRRYWCGVQIEKRIKLSDMRKGKTKNVLVPELIPPTWKETIRFESSANGKHYIAKFGILDVVGKNAGIFLAYGFRTIEILTALSHRSLPPKLHGQIILSEDWGNSLSRLKTSIVHDRDELLSDIENKIAALIDQIDEELKQVKDKEFNQIITANANKARKKRQESFETRPQPVPSGPNATIIPMPSNPPKPPREKTEQLQYGYAIQWLHLGPDIMELVSVNDEKLVITLNADFSAIAALREQDMWPATTLHLGSCIVSHTSKLGIDEIKRYFGYMLADQKDSNNREIYSEYIRIWWASRSQELSNRRDEISKANLAKAQIARRTLRASQKGSGGEQE